MRPDGKSSEFDPAQLVETTDLRYGDYDLVRASIAVPGVEPGCIVEWHYTLEGEAAEFGGWRFEFENRIYTCVSTHTWHSSTWWKEELARSWHYTGISSALVEEHCEPDCAHPQTVTFTLRNRAGVHDEEMAPPQRDATPHVTVFYGATTTTDYWSAWKSAFDSYQYEAGKQSGDLEAVMHDIRSRHVDPDSALAEAFHWVQDHTHSFAESSPESRASARKALKSYRLAPSLKAVLDRRETSPFEINCLMASAARLLGFTAAVGFVGDRRFEVFDPQVKGMPPANSITVVNDPHGGLLFLQPDSRFSIFGSVPWYLRGGRCLLTGQTRDLMLGVPADAGATASSEWRVQCRIDADGAIDGRIDGHLHGEEAATWKRDLWSEDAAGRVKLLASRLAEHGGPATTFETPTLDVAPDSEFVLHATAHWPSITTVSGNRVVVPFDKLIPWRTQARFQPEHRSQPVLFDYPRDETIRVALNLAPGLKVERLPDPQEFTNPLGSWSIRWSNVEGRPTVERRLVLAHAEVSPQNYGAVREFFHSLDQADQSVLLVTKEP